jgi:hypothetical protein
MVLELRAPEEPTLAALVPLGPVFLSYVLSYVNLGIYWNNHHHMIHVTSRVNGAILWANLYLLFWLSLFPFVTAWMGQHFEPVPARSTGGDGDGGDCLRHSSARNPRAGRARESVLAAAVGPGRQGEDLAAVVCARNPGRIRQSGHCWRALRDSGADLVGTRSAQSSARSTPPIERPRPSKRSS